jgi:hypothetical protein
MLATAVHAPDSCTSHATHGLPTRAMCVHLSFYARANSCQVARIAPGVVQMVPS